VNSISVAIRHRGIRLRMSANTGLLVAALLVISGCATTKTVNKVDRLASIAPNPRILLMTPDVKLSLLTASGMTEPQAEWTSAARKNFLDAADAFGRQRKVEIIRMPEDAVLTEAEIAYQRLYEAVGTTILINYVGQQKLPTKSGGFDWSLGSGVSAIKEKYGADYALFTFYRDSKSSGGRIAMMVLFAAAGIGVPGGGQGGFGSLVDLNTGDVVWFNLVQSGSGDLRTAEGANTAVQQLFSSLPER
jgi:hypothetical protein